MRKMLVRWRLAWTLLVALVAAGLAVGMSHLEPARALEHHLEDARFVARSTPWLARFGVYRPLDADPRIVIIGKDRATYDALRDSRGMPLPTQDWTQFYAPVLEGLHDANVAAFGFDVLLRSPSTHPEFDDAMGAALADLAPQGLVMAVVVRNDPPSVEKSIFMQEVPTVDVANGGAANEMSDENGIIRRAQLFVPLGDLNFPSMGLMLTHFAQHVPLPTAVSRGVVTLGDRRIPTDDEGGMPINYASGFGYVSFLDAWRHRDDKAFYHDKFHDKIVLLGDWDPIDKRDYKVTPLYGMRGFTPGVEVQANVVNTLLSGRLLRALPVSGLFSLAAAVAVALLAMLLPLRWSWIGLLVLVGLGTWLDFLVFSNRDLIVPMVAPALASAIAFAGTLALHVALARERLQVSEQKRTEAEIALGRLNPGDMLQKHYRIVRPIGAGGMGSVYLAVDERFDVQVALKQMRLDDEGEEMVQKRVEQFRKEATILRRLRHPGVVGLTDFFEEAGRQYIVMDFIEGSTLEGVIKESVRGLDLERGLRLARDLGEILLYLHTFEPPVIFKDLKPANIMLRSDGTLCLVDFGIARTADTRTATAVAGAASSGFAPYEQYGFASSDQRSDIYAFGATLHNSLTGRYPPNSVDIMMKSETLFPPSTFNPEVPPELDAIVLKMMAIQPDDRYQSIRQVLDALATVPGGQ